MKKTLIGIFMLLGAVAYSNSKVEVKGAYDLDGKYHFERGSQKADSNAFELGAEYRYEVTPGLEVGGGVAYQSHKDLKNFKNVDMYDSVPVYATAKYTFDTPVAVKPYIKGDLGYSINTDDTKDGLYYGVGGGVNINNFNVDLMYKENKGKYTVGTSDYKRDYKRVSLGVGYDFNLDY